jgi:hypothetical protein
MDEFDAVFMFEGERLNMSSRGYMKVQCTLPWWSKRRHVFNRVNNCHAKRSRDILKDEEKFCSSFLVF